MNAFYFNIQNRSKYPDPPFHPNKEYPEFNGIFTEFDNSNLIYEMVRDLFLNAKYDDKNAGTKNWNPFRGLIRNNQVVVIKPNLVMEEKMDLIGSGCITTHPCIIRPILDYLYLLMIIDDINIKIIIADVPLQSTNFELLIQQNGLSKLVNYYKDKFNLHIELIDLRKEIKYSDDSGFDLGNRVVNNDPLGYINIYLNESFLDEIIDYSDRFSIGGYDDKDTSGKHQKGSHFYQIPKTILSADLFINVPKIKTHQKAGITIAMKNLIGIVGDKSWVPHYIKGIPILGGDEFSSNNPLLLLNKAINKKIQGKSILLWCLKKKILNFIRKDRKNIHYNNYLPRIKNIGSGAWYGNKTLWRPILDLNRILIYTTKDGLMTNKVQRKYICLSEGIVIGMGDGPLNPIPKKAGLITLSKDPVINDVCCSRIMGFSWDKIPTLKNSSGLLYLTTFNGKTDELVIYGSLNEKIFTKYKYNDLPSLKILPSPGWIGHIEIEENI